jgi:dihydrodipicolinate synthase/N-acetylneuraminate lyase
MTLWKGVWPAATTPFRQDFELDHPFLREHVGWLVERGCRGIVALGSLGEGSTLEPEEKVEVLESCAAAIGGRVPLMAGIAALSTSQAVSLARAAEGTGCSALMALPPYVYRGDWPETRRHFRAVIGATKLPCMLYNNPIAYGTDVTPEQIEELSEIGNLEAVKESSADVRRVTAIRERLGDRLAIFVGVDDVLLEGVAAGAVGWIAGLANALPEESVRLFDLAAEGRHEQARALYEWFLPLLRLDTVPKFVQLIKLVQAQVGRGSEIVRPPRLPLEGEERERALSLIRERLALRPRIDS